MLNNTIPVIYINLEKRLDRNSNVLKEFKKIGVNEPIRFKAIELENGALGCSMSHLKCIEIAKQNNYDSVFICEDDIEFLNPELFLKQLTSFINSSLKWDVAIVAGNNMIPFIPISDFCIQVYNCQTTTGYIIKSHYYDTLIKNFKDGIHNLMKEPSNNDYKIDKYWFKLQRLHNWYMIIPPSIIQKEDYSDIEKKNTNFSKFFLDYNKAYKSSKSSFI
jgi:glycosyl transferase family 25